MVSPSLRYMSLCLLFFLIHCICKKKNCNLLCTIIALKSQAIYQVVIHFLHIKPFQNLSFFLRFKKMQKKIYLAQKKGTVKHVVHQVW